MLSYQLFLIWLSWNLASMLIKTSPMDCNITKYGVIWSQYGHFVTTLQLHLTKNFLTKVVDEYALINKCHRDYSIWNHLVEKCSFRHNFLWCTEPKNFFNKSRWRVYTYTGNGIETTRFGIIWSQNVHFVTTLMVPLKKNLFNKSC